MRALVVTLSRYGALEVVCLLLLLVVVVVVVVVGLKLIFLVWSSLNVR